MNKTKLAVILLATILVISVAVNVYFAVQSYMGKNSAQTKVDMVSALTHVQVLTVTELQNIGNSLIYASQQLALTGLTGYQADAVLSALAANSTFIINAATENLDNVIVAVEPANWNSIEGRNVGEQIYLNPNPYGAVTPVMSPVIALQSDIMGNALAAPVFGADKELIGVVSVIFDPQTLIGASFSQATAGKSYELIGMQLDGLMVYDSDPAQQWKNLFTDEAYANYTSLLTLGHQITEEPSGYGTYTYNLIGSIQLVEKECYWTTISAYGQEWRLSIINTLN